MIVIDEKLGGTTILDVTLDFEAPKLSEESNKDDILDDF